MQGPQAGHSQLAARVGKAPTAFLQHLQSEMLKHLFDVFNGFAHSGGVIGSVSAPKSLK